MASWDEALVRFAFDFARRVTGHDADAEDLAQEALLELAEAAPSHVGERAFVGRRIVLGAKMLRRANLTRARHERAVVRQGVEGRGEEGAEARDALDLLDAEDRHAVELRFLHGLSYAEVAHVLGVSEPAARMRVHRALGALRARLGPRAESMIAALPLFLAPPSLGLETARAAALAGGGIAVKKIAALVLLLALAGGGLVASRAMRADAPVRAEHPWSAAGRTPAPEEAGPSDAEETRPLPPDDPPKNEAPVAGKPTLVGRIVFEDGEPLRRAELALLGTDMAWGATDDEGSFRFRGDVVPGGLGLVLRKDSYMAIARVEPNVAEPLRLDVTLKRGTTLEGVVRKTGSPVYNANIALQRPAAEATGDIQGSFGACKTDAEGRFLFPYLPDGLYTLLITRYGIEPRHVEVKVEPGLPPQIIAVTDARALRIRVVPLSRAWHDKRTFRIDSVDPASTIRLRHFLAPDERGEMVVGEAPPPGRYVLAGLPGGYHAFEVTEASVPDVVVDLSRYGKVFGTVSSPCAVRIGPATAKAGADGRYEVDLVPPGEAQVEIQLDKAMLYRPSVNVPESGEVRLDIELRGVTVRGRLRPGPSALVSVKGKQPSIAVALRRAGHLVGLAWVDDEGRFSIPFVEPGDYEVTGFKTGDAQGQARRISVGAEDVDLGDVVTEPGPVVAVVVTAPADVRLAGKHLLHAWDGREHRSLDLLLDDGGRGKVQLPAGAWRLSLNLADLPQKDVEVDVPARVPVRFDLAR